MLDAHNCGKMQLCCFVERPFPEHRILIRINILVSKNIDIDFVKNIDNINIQSIDFFFFSSKNIDSNNDFFLPKILI